jgi:hypothetical protein
VHAPICAPSLCLEVAISFSEISALSVTEKLPKVTQGHFSLIVRSPLSEPRLFLRSRVRPLTVGSIPYQRCDLHNRRWGCPRDLRVPSIQDGLDWHFRHPRFDFGIIGPLQNHLRCIAIGGIDRVTPTAPEMISLKNHLGPPHRVRIAGEPLYIAGN